MSNYYLTTIDSGIQNKIDNYTFEDTINAYYLQKDTFSL